MKKKKNHTEGYTRLFEIGDFTQKSGSRVKRCKFSCFSILGRKKFFFNIYSFNLCGKSCNWVSRWDLRTSGFTPTVTLMPCLCQVPFCWPSGFLPCTRWLGSKPSSPLFLGWNSEKWLCLTKSHLVPWHKVLLITWHTMAFPFPSPRCDPVPGPALQPLMLIKAEISCFSARSLQPLKVGSFLALGTNSLLLEDHMNIMDTFFTI